MKRFIISFAIILSALNCLAQNTLTVEAPNIVTPDETFRIVFTANGKMSNFEWGGTSDFDIVWGPQKGSMSSTNIVNGKRTSSHQETVTYLLQPKQAGKFTIQGATATVGGDNCSSRSFTIEVVADGAQQSAAQQQSQQSGGSKQQSNQSMQATGTVAGSDLFLKLTLSKTNAVKGEPISATLKIYTRTDIAGFEDIHFPTFNGFWSKETVTINNLEFQRENVNGTIYNSALLRKYMLIPQQSGTLTIDPAEMVCQVRVSAAQNPSRSVFDDFFDNYQTIRKRISTGEIKVKVSDIPAGAPATFKGGVGTFKISAELSKSDVKSNEAAALTFTVSGTGNISMLEAPDIDFPSDFEVYDIKSTEKIGNDGASGSKSFEFPFIPRSHGDYVIPSINYSYYDISKGKYVTLNTGNIPVHIEKGADVDAGGVPMAGITRHGVRNLSDDIRYIHLGDGDFKTKGKFLAGSVLFYILVALIIAAFFAANWWLKFTEARRADVVGTKNRKANKMARTKLRVAGDYLEKGLSSAYYEELHKALIGYVSDKLSIPAAALSRESIVEGLSHRGVSQQTISEFTAIVDKCEFARYSPDNEQVQMQNEYNESIRIISQLESEVKKPGKKKTAAVMIVALLCIGATAFAQEEQPIQEQPVQEEQPVQTQEAEGVAGLWQKGNEAFAEQQWQNALNFYKMIEGENLQSEDLYYNIGNSYFKMGDNAHAILYYEKALKLNPSNNDAQNNLAIANQFILDKIESVPEFFVITWIHTLVNSFSADNWAGISLIFLAVAAALLLLYRFGINLRLRKVSFVISVIVLVFSISAFIISISQKHHINANDSAIIVSPVSSVKSSPSEAGNAIFVLHEGTKVNILDEVGEWQKISIADGRQGWINKSTSEEI